MRNIKYTAFIILACFVVFLFHGCDQVTPGDYLQKKSVDTTNVDTSKYIRKILIEDFTGFKCPNCPRSHDKIDELKATYGNRLMSLAIHAGIYARPDKSHTYDFRTEVGNELYSFFQITQNPTGLVNRKTINGSRLFDDSGFESAMGTMINDTPKVILKLEPSFNSQTREITVKVNAKYLTASSANDNLCVYIAEDSIVQYQVDQRKTPAEIPDYVHNNILRGSFNGTWGDQLSSTGIKPNDSFDKTYKLTIPADKDWRPEKLKIIAFVHDNGASYEIWQVEEAKLIK